MSSLIEFPANCLMDDDGLGGGMLLFMLLLGGFPMFEFDGEKIKLF